jgi:hypothetical protein
MHIPVETGFHMGGTHDRYRFPNGYGASVVRNQYSYGGDQGLFELAVTDHKGHLIYTTPVTSDVVGYLSADEVQQYLDQIAALPTIEVHKL